MSLISKKSMYVIIVAVVAILVFGYYIFSSTSPAQISQDLWTGSCGNESQSLVIKYEFKKGGFDAPDYKQLLLVLRQKDGTELARTSLDTALKFPLNADDFTLYPYKEESNNVLIILQSNNAQYYPVVRDCINKNRAGIEKSMTDFVKSQMGVKDYSSLGLFSRYNKAALSTTGETNIFILVSQKSTAETEFKNPLFPERKIYIENTSSINGSVKYVYGSKVQGVPPQEYSLGDLISLEDDITKETRAFLKSATVQKEIDYATKTLERKEELLKDINGYVNTEGQTFFQYRDAVLKKFGQIPRQYLTY